MKSGKAKKLSHFNGHSKAPISITRDFSPNEDECKHHYRIQGKFASFAITASCLVATFCTATRNLINSWIYWSLNEEILLQGLLMASSAEAPPKTIQFCQWRRCERNIKTTSCYIVNWRHLGDEDLKFLFNLASRWADIKLSSFREGKRFKGRWKYFIFKLASYIVLALACYKVLAMLFERKLRFREGCDDAQAWFVLKLGSIPMTRKLFPFEIKLIT